MAECVTEEGARSSPIQRIYRHLQKQPGSYERGDDILRGFDHVIRDYLQGLKPDSWPEKPRFTVDLSASDTYALKQYLVWSLEQKHFVQTCGALLLLDKSGHIVQASVLDDVLQHIEEQDYGHVIPPQLLIGWAKVLQNKGDLHGTIRRLNKAKSLLQETTTPCCKGEIQMVLGECSQLTGLTLNKMCCWKSAVFPLVESVETFRKTAEDGTTPSCVVSMEMAAKCLCAITHEDFMELKEKLGFQHDNKFYQAYKICKEAASLAGDSHLLLTRVLNQACESLLMYSAERDDLKQRFLLLESVTSEAKKSLQVHGTLEHLSNREQFFQFVRSLFLLCLALEFSDNPQDEVFAQILEERAKILYGEYCRQLCERGFLLQTVDLKETPKVLQIITAVKEEFGLTLDIPSCSDEDRKLSVTEGVERSTVGGKLQNEFSHRLNISPSAPHAKQIANGHSGETDVGVTAEGVNISPDHGAVRREVGLPVNPADYAIPQYDVPHSIFQDLCGCKFTPAGPVPRVQRQEAAEFPSILTTSSTGSGRGLTEDSGYGPSLVLANTFLTTKLPDTCGSTRSDTDSGVDSSSCSSSEISSAARDKKIVLSGCVYPASNGAAANDNVKRARLLKFNPVTGLWTSQTTLVYVGHPLCLEDKVKGNCRDALEVQFLHQDEVLGRYVGKRYKRQRPPSQYLQDVTCQKTARFLVTLFNYALNDLRYDIQVVYVPVAHLQLLSRDGQVEDWLNVEPYLEGDFVKLTNNLSFCNNQGRTLATALTHFSHSVSDGRLMLVDLQGWLPREGRGVVYLTDPQFHTDNKTSLSSCDMGARGMQAFWEIVHPQCNAICHALRLKRPEQK